MAAVLTPAARDATVRDFLEDERIFKDLKDYEGKTKAEKDIEKRHCMQLVSNQQYAAGLRFTGGVCTQAFLDLVARQRSGLISTQICEDTLGVQKNAGELKAANPYTTWTHRSINMCAMLLIISDRGSCSGVAVRDGGCDS